MVGGIQLLHNTLHYLTSGRQHAHAMELWASPCCIVGSTRLPGVMGRLGMLLLGCLFMVGSASRRGSSKQHGARVGQAGIREAKMVHP